MRRKQCLHTAMFAGLGILTVATLAGCAKSGSHHAQVMPANMIAAAPAATAALPPGYGGQAIAGTQPRAGARYPQTAAGPRFAQVVAVQPLTRSETTSSPHRVCRDERVAVPETYRDRHQIGGAVVGGLVGGLLGNQIGDGRGRTLATLAGAAGGAFAGHEIQKDHQQDNRSRMEMRYVCHTVNDTTRSVQTVGYDVTYILNGRAGHVRMDHNPGVGVGLPVRNGVVVAGMQQAGRYYNR